MSNSYEQNKGLDILFCVTKNKTLIGVDMEPSAEVGLMIELVF